MIALCPLGSTEEPLSLGCSGWWVLAWPLACAGVGAKDQA
jgi:hypothetical protein